MGILLPAPRQLEFPNSIEDLRGLALEIFGRLVGSRDATRTGAIKSASTLPALLRALESCVEGYQRFSRWEETRDLVSQIVRLRDYVKNKIAAESREIHTGK